ncbi:glycosyltransferase family 4 protein [uncultured Akkermansia sp.]|uniref:glycosyltransferase family 4 protein n=1 Tax=uncultured Akkermansia sp. TaxID=512294 RepID=UPI0025DE053C|nr:glycosyltransferase family 4 protein [uncultured Akkermansia sp.]
MFHFLTISNLNASKGIFVLLDACALLKDEGLSFHLHVVGAETAEISGEWFSKELCQRSLQNHVTYHGRQYNQDKENRFSEAAALVHPTLNDCFPLVLLEAMQHSLPIISTPVGAIPDMVREEENGFLVPENDPAALAEAMRKLIEHPQLARDMGRRGYSRFMENHTSNRFETNLLEILKNI